MKNKLTTRPHAPPTPQQSRRTPLLEHEADWQRHLPAAWAEQVEPALYFRAHREYEIDAERTVGYDADDQPCFTAHRVTLTRIASDDDETFYQEITYCEELAAWRLRDERWLIFRQSSAADCNPARGFYSFSPHMPR